MEWNNKIKKIISSSKLYHLRLKEQINDRFSESFILYRGENAVKKFIEIILKEKEYDKKW